MAAPTRIKGAVSPMALDSERIVPVMIPGRAAGRTWSRTTCQRVAPRARAALRSEFGTVRRASCEAMTTIGRTRSESVRPPAQSVGPRANRLQPKASRKAARPRRPYTTDGTPARLAMFVWITRFSRPGGAYSSRKTAAPTPIGIAVNATNASSQRLPTSPTLKPSSAGSIEPNARRQPPEIPEQLGGQGAGMPPGTARGPSQLLAVVHAEGRDDDRPEQDRQDRDPQQGRQEAGKPEGRAHQRLKGRSGRYISPAPGRSFVDLPEPAEDEAGDDIQGERDEEERHPHGEQREVLGESKPASPPMTCTM